MSAADLLARARSLRAAALWMLPVPLIAGLASWAWLGTPAWTFCAVGAAGWLGALVLRQPVAWLVRRAAEPERLETIVGWASGPAEELTRVVLLAAFAHTLREAFWLGLGWGAVEVLLIMVNALVLAQLLARDDDKARALQALLLARQGPVSAAPGWAALERCSAMLLHAGLALLLYVMPWLAPAAMLLHSATNMLAVRMVKRSVRRAEAVVLCCAGAVFLCGLAVNGGLA